MHISNELTIATQPISTRATILAPVIAPATVPLIDRWVHALSPATCLRVLALVPTLSTVEFVAHHIHTLFVATIGAGAALGYTNPRVLVTRHLGTWTLS